MEDNKGDILPIEGFDGYYITRDGRVFSGKSGRMRKIKPFIYESESLLVFKKVKLYSNGNRYTRMVHRLVYETFSDMKIKKNIPVYFKDLNTLNCSFDNLSLEFPEYQLESGEDWISGFEGRYTIYKGEVFSVWQRDNPKRLKPYTDSGARKYTLYDGSGKAYTFYLSDNNEYK